MKLVKLLVNFGYGSCKQVQGMFCVGLIIDVDGEVLYVDDVVVYEVICVEGELLDLLQGLIVLLYKLCGYICFIKDIGWLIYDLLLLCFCEWLLVLFLVGWLDCDISGMLLMIDDGVLLYWIVLLKLCLDKVYEVIFVEDLWGDEVSWFVSGMLLLELDDKFLLFVELDVWLLCQVQLVLYEGCYYQVCCMFVVVGNYVEVLYCSCIGGLLLGDLVEGQWCMFDVIDLDILFDVL